MLTNVTFSLPEGTVKRLRKRAKDSGRKKGAISEMVDEAIARYLDTVETPPPNLVFTALRGRTPVARAESLERLAALLKSKGTDPRSVRIISSEPLEPVGRFGLRIRAH